MQKRFWNIICGAVLAISAFGAVTVHAAEAEVTAPQPQVVGGGVRSEAVAAPSKNGVLHVEGTWLVGEDGTAVQLRGISTHGIAWYPQYINENCFRQFHEMWNVNVMRLAMYTAESGGYCTDGDQEYLKNLVEQGVQYAAAADMYVIVDWHVLSDCDPNIHKDEAKKFFAEMSEWLSAYDNVLYEICNEPNGGTQWAAVKSYAEEIIPIIREHAPDAVILVGTPNWSQYVDQAAADPITDYDNIMYTLHYYAATHKEDLRSRMTAAIDAGLPVFVSEYGICDASGNGALDIEEANRWVDTLNQYGVSYVAWNLSNKNESSAIISPACQKDASFTQDDLTNSGKWLYGMLTGNPGNGNMDNAAGVGDAENGNTDNAAGADNAEHGSADRAAGASDAKNGSTDNVADANNAEHGSADNTSGAGNTENGNAGSADSSAQTVFTSGQMKCTATIKNSWEENGQTFFQYDLVLENTGGSCTQWAVDVPFSDVFTLSDGWNGTYTEADTVLHIENADYNGAVESGGYVTDIGFIVSGSSGLTLAADAKEGNASNDEERNLPDAEDDATPDVGEKGSSDDKEKNASEFAEVNASDAEYGNI